MTDRLFYRDRYIQITYSLVLKEWMYFVLNNSTPFIGSKRTREQAIDAAKTNIDLFESFN